MIKLPNGQKLVISHKHECENFLVKLGEFEEYIDYLRVAKKDVYPTNIAANHSKLAIADLREWVNYLIKYEG